jgi:hypothetical protein
LAISHHHPLGSLSSLGFPNEEAPFCERTITPDFGIDLRGRLGKSRPTSNSFAESSTCQDNVVKRLPNAGRVALFNSKTLTCL